MISKKIEKLINNQIAEEQFAAYYYLSMSAYFESLEFLRLGKTNLTYINYPEADHGFNRSAIVNGHTENTNKIDKAFHTALQ